MVNMCLGREKLAAAAINPMITCPALMLAASRKARVIGRIADLRISIRISKGARASGALLGRRWAIRHLSVGRPRISRVAHSGTDHLNVTARWAVSGIAYGAIPSRFKVRILAKRGV